MNEIENGNEMDCAFCGNTKCTKGEWPTKWVYDCPDCGKWFVGDCGGQVVIETKCHACKVIHNPQDIGCKLVLCEEAGWLYLCKDCPSWVKCYKCKEYIHPNDAIVVGEVAGYYDHMCDNRAKECVDKNIID